eukprot:Phypoly_transcript_06845.p1 GENE.Phypoly_transcript_06845~~Phypoly_transcript_06845.p1  ORF type:complete len:530 (+),score=62.33 Phypoly_transcript_06845:46-1590(+)
MELVKGLGTVIEGTAALLIRSPSPPRVPPSYFRLPSSVKVHWIQDDTLGENKIKHLISQLKTQIPPVVVGFDVEWGDNEQVALVQLSSDIDCYLMHVCHMESLPESLKTILEDSSILKVGVGVVGDGKQIWQSYAIHTRGLVDLRPLAQHYGYQPRGLAHLAESILGVNMNKNPKVRCSQWGNKELSEEQIEYAALDAWIGHKIFVELNNKPPVAENSSTMEELCNTHADRRDTYAKPIKQPNPNKLLSLLDPDKDQQGHPVRKSQLYYNCQLMSPDGTILCKCDLKKIGWYLDRNLGEIVAQDPLTLKFNFAPKGMGHAGDPYYMSAKANECVSCGATELLSRHSIIPHSYRAHLPARYKNRTSHDIVLLCQKCQHTMAIMNGRLRQIISTELSSQLPPPPARIIDPEIIRVRSAATALLKKRDALPAERLDELHETLKKHFNKDDITVDDIKSAATIHFAKFEYHEDEEIAKLVGDQGHEEIMKFVKRWRVNFLDSLKPKKMPEHWDVEHEY